LRPKGCAFSGASICARRQAGRLALDGHIEGVAVRDARNRAGGGVALLRQAVGGDNRAKRKRGGVHGLGLTGESQQADKAG